MAKEGDTVEPGTKIAVISKSGEGVAHVAPSEKTSDKASSQPPAAEKKIEEKPKAEAATESEKPKATKPPPPKTSASEPQLPPKERERRVSLIVLYIHITYSCKSNCEYI